MRIVSWNVNGIRSCETKGFSKWIETIGADVVGVQEVRAKEDQFPSTCPSPPLWHRHVVAGVRPGYSGVALFSRKAPDDVETLLGDERFDCEGRLQIARFGRLAIANVYFPNGNGKERDNSRIPFKLEFYQALFEKLERLRRDGRRVLVMGDFNTAHQEIDLARPKDNVETSGFTKVEREEFDRWIRAGWADTFRRFEQGPGHYTWWSQRFGVRARNVGWRIDYVLACPEALPHVKGAFHHPTTLGSDHCPVGIDLDPTIV